MDDAGPGGFAPPPFDAAAALQTLQRELRALGLAEREGAFGRADRAFARAALDEAGALQAALAREPARRPDWQPRTLRSHAELRDFVAELKKRMARWKASDD